MVTEARIFLSSSTSAIMAILSGGVVFGADPV
jgi:hypothetical protein